MPTFASVGRDGKYAITSAGVHPQGGEMFDYRSERHRFRFYCDYADGRAGEVVEITAITGDGDDTRDGLRGPSRSELPVVEENISAYFDRFTLWGNDLHGRPPSITFPWRKFWE